MRSIFAMTFLLSALASPAVNANECAHRVIFLPQTHAADKLTGAQTTLAQNIQIAASQLKIANYIERFPDVPIFSEQAAAQDFSIEMLPSEKRAALKQMYDEQIFPDGLPKNSESLNEVQIQKLIDNGGEFVQMIRGHANILHKVVEDEKTLNAIFEPIKHWFNTKSPTSATYPPEIGRLVYGARERAALSQIQKFFTANNSQRDVILIYGSNHAFNFYPEEFPSECVVIPTEFLDDWGGKFRSGPEGFPNY